MSELQAEWPRVHLLRHLQEAVSLRLSFPFHRTLAGNHNSAGACRRSAIAALGGGRTTSRDAVAMQGHITEALHTQYAPDNHPHRFPVSSSSRPLPSDAPNSSFHRDHVSQAEARVNALCITTIHESGARPRSACLLTPAFIVHLNIVQKLIPFVSSSPARPVTLRPCVYPTPYTTYLLHTHYGRT